MSLADELSKLEDLRWNGTLTDEEFAKAKSALLAKLSHQADGRSENAVAEVLGEQLAESRYKNELDRIDREWELEREKYIRADRHGRRQIPTAGAGKLAALFGGIFGALWTIMAFGMTRGAPDDGVFAFVKVFFPLFGVVVTVGAIVFGLSISVRANAYTKALAEYQRRRGNVKREDFK